MDDRRRVLYNTLTQEDIPSSAVEITNNNYSTLEGNVLYIPTNKYYGSSFTAGSDLSCMKISPKTGSTIRLSSIGHITWNTYPSIPGGNIYLPGEDSSWRYSAMLNFSGGGSSGMSIIGSDFVYSPNGHPGYIPKPREDDDIYYIKIKFVNQIVISSLGSYITNGYYPPIYLDTED